MDTMTDRGITGIINQPQQRRTTMDPRTYNQRVEDELEAAWTAGEISHADACAALEELPDRP